MPVSDEKIAEINTAIEKVMVEQKSPEEKKNEETKTNGGGNDNSNKTNMENKVATGTGDTKVSELLKKETVGSEKSSDIDDKTIKDDSSIKKDDIKSEIKPEEKPTVSDYALTQAIQAGFTIEEAREYGNDKLLMRAVDKIRTIYENSLPEKKSIEDDPLKDFPKFDPEEFESPEVAKAFNALTEIVKKQQEQIKDFNEYTKHTAGQQQEANAREVTEWFDSKVSSLGKDFEDALGTGKYNLLDRASLQFQKRDEVAKQVSVLLAGYQASGQQIPSRDELFDTAAKLVLSDKFQEIREKKVAKDLATRSQQHINRADGSNNKVRMSPEEEVAAEIDAKFYGK